jgi:2,3-bisphosphoglycerate-dependent phosphoglycerate mutase
MGTMRQSLHQKSVRLTFLRHGQSTWNKENKFIGMTDTPLTKEGEREAKQAGRMLAQSGVEYDHVFSSVLMRSTDTARIVLKELNMGLNVKKDWRLNERNYGALVGADKKKCVEQFGQEQVRRWRRSWDEPPPPMTADSPFWPFKDSRYQQLGLQEEDIPASESLKDVTMRTSVFWDEEIMPLLALKKRILIVGHENNLRSIIKRLDGLSREEILNVELPRAIPLVFDLDPINLRPLRVTGAHCGNSGRYLCSKEQLDSVLERDHHQVYDTSTSPSTSTHASASVGARIAEGFFQQQQQKYQQQQQMGYSTLSANNING